MLTLQTVDQYDSDFSYGPPSLTRVIPQYSTMNKPNMLERHQAVSNLISQHLQ